MNTKLGLDASVSLRIARPFTVHANQVKSAAHIVIATLRALADEGKIDPATVDAAIGELGVDPDAPNPVTV